MLISTLYLRQRLPEIPSQIFYLPYSRIQRPRERDREKERVRKKETKRESERERESGGLLVLGIDFRGREREVGLG